MSGSSISQWECTQFRLKNKKEEEEGQGDILTRQQEEIHKRLRYLDFQCYF